MVRQAQLTWAEDLDCQDFVETGRLGEEPTDVLPFDPDLRKAVIKQFQKG